jgi:hypothetical protein
MTQADSVYITPPTNTSAIDALIADWQREREADADSKLPAQENRNARSHLAS